MKYCEECRYSQAEIYRSRKKLRCMCPPAVTGKRRPEHGEVAQGIVPTGRILSVSPEDARNETAIPAWCSFGGK